MAFGIGAAPLWSEKQSERKTAGERHAQPLKQGEEFSQSPLHRGTDSRNHTAEYWFAALFHEL